MGRNDKRTRALTVHLTEEEAQLIERLADMSERKPAELARLLLNKKALEEWGRIQYELHPENRQPFTPAKFSQ